MKVNDILSEYEFLPTKNKQQFFIKAWRLFHNEICEEEFIKEFLETFVSDVKKDVYKNSADEFIKEFLKLIKTNSSEIVLEDKNENIER
jgi:hypothetical protein